MYISDEKKLLRLKYRKIRSEIEFDHKKEAEVLLLKNFIHYIAIDKESSIAGYRPIDNEINVLPIMNFFKNNGNEISTPIIDKKTDKLLFLNQLNKKVLPNVIIVPLIAFDKNLNRLGFGGGYYDKLISCSKNRKCIFIGVAYESQFCDKIPVTPFDQPLDAIVTEKYLRKQII